VGSELLNYLKGVSKSDFGATDDSIQDLQKHLDFKLPNEYLDLMKEFNGGEGEVGENSWLCLFPVEKLVSINQNYHLLMEQIPDYFLFGKDAADTGFAFHKNKKTIHSFGLMSNFKTDPIELCGNTFIEFIEYLYNQ
jgi:hypothetical protein